MLLLRVHLCCGKQLQLIVTSTPDGDLEGRLVFVEFEGGSALVLVAKGRKDFEVFLALVQVLAVSVGKQALC